MPAPAPDRQIPPQHVKKQAGSANQQEESKKKAKKAAKKAAKKNDAYERGGSNSRPSAASH
jgi:hypothetical protein